jgi:hypothetical protein
MRHVLLSAFVLVTGSAQAQSVQPLATNTHGATASFVTRTCSNCPPLKPVEDKSGYNVPVLKDGVQSVAVMDIDGQKKIVRTDIWMGGSPVVHVSKVPAWMTTEQLQAVVDTGNGLSTEAGIESATAPATPIDFNAKTGAVEDNGSISQTFDGLPLRRD